ncbi:MAG TPA: succinate dehydrogenase, cytochrome b556 subunit [Legionellales bacterium]|nr:succinate dehydrogenase, cytochrome b556 subunit [Legionellales bacterium]
MNKKRPINLDLTTLHFPVMAITSIMHRISGILVFVLLPFMLFYFQQSVRTAESFNHLQDILVSPFHRLVLWAFLSALSYHFMAGVRHIIADYGYGETVNTAKKTAWVLLSLTVITTVGLGVWIW